METLAAKLLDYLKGQSFQVAVVFAAVLILTWLLRNRSAHVRYLLWLLVAIKCLTPPMMIFSVPVLPAETVSAVTPTQSPDVEYQPAPTDYQQTKNTVITITPAEMQVPIENRKSSIVNFLIAHLDFTLISVWAAGGAFYLLWAAAKAIRLQLWLRQNHRPVGPQMAGEIEELSRLWNPNKAFTVRLLDNISQPFVWGLWRGAIYLPSRIQSIQTDRQKAIVMHEMAHVIRWDSLLNLIQILIQGLFWFHPLVWLANRFIRQEREKCCDETAIARLNTHPKEYGSAIIETLVQEYRNTIPIPSLAVAGPIKNIEDRIKTIMQPGRRFFRRPSIIALLIIGCVAALVVPTTIALTQADMSPNHTVTGTVTDAQTGAPIAGAEVFDDGYNDNKGRTITSDDGKFELKTWNEEHFISAGAKGYESHKQLLKTFPFANNKNFDFQLKKLSSDAGIFSPTTITFKKNMPLRDALQMVGKMYKKNIIPSDKITGIIPVTDLYDITSVEQILQAILGTNKYIVDGNFIRVYTEDEFSNLPPTHSSAFTTMLPDGVTVELIGICKDPLQDNQEWWLPNGSIYTAPQYEKPQKKSWTNPFFGYLVKITSSEEISFDSSNSSGCPEMTFKSGDNIVVAGGWMKPSEKCPDLIDIEMKIAGGEWQQPDVAPNNMIYPDFVRLVGKDSGITLSGLRSNPDTKLILKTLLEVTTKEQDLDVRLVAKLKNNEKIISEWNSKKPFGGLLQYELGFRCNIDQIEKISVQYRWFQKVIFKNISLRPGQKTEAKIEIQKPQDEIEQIPYRVAAPYNDPKFKHRFFLTIVADKDNQISSRGEKTSFEEIEALMSITPGLSNTVLEVAFEPNILPADVMQGNGIWQWLAQNPVWQKANQLVRKYHLEYPSFIGEDTRAFRDPSSIRIQETFAMDKDIAVGLPAGSMFANGPVMTVESVRFAGGDPVLAAKLDLSILSHPKGWWNVKMQLLDKDGKPIGTDTKFYHTPSVNVDSATSLHDNLIFNFKKRDLSTIAKFEIEIREDWPAPQKPQATVVSQADQSPEIAADIELRYLSWQPEKDETQNAEWLFWTPSGRFVMADDLPPDFADHNGVSGHTGKALCLFFFSSSTSISDMSARILNSQGQSLPTFFNYTGGYNGWFYISHAFKTKNDWPEQVDIKASYASTNSPWGTIANFDAGKGVIKQKAIAEGIRWRYETVDYGLKTILCFDHEPDFDSVEYQMMGLSGAVECQHNRVGQNGLEMAYLFPELTPHDLGWITIQKRPRTTKIFRNVSLRPGQKTEVKIETQNSGVSSIADATLEFRIVPNIGEDISESTLKQYKESLETHGPDGDFHGHKWVAANTSDNTTWYNALPWHRYKDTVYVLLCDQMHNRMLADGTWGLQKVSVDTASQNFPSVLAEFDDEGASLFQSLTQQNVGQRLALIVNGKIISAPQVKTPISKQAVITGRFTNEELAYLTQALVKGMPPAGPRVTIEARFILADEAVLKQAGIDLNKTYGTVTVMPADSNNITDLFKNNSLENMTVESSDPNLLDDAQVKSFLKAIQQNKNSKMLATPKAMVMNKESATIAVSTNTEYFDPADNRKKTFNREIQLTICPQADDAGKNIALKVRVLMSDLLKPNTQQAPASVPQAQVLDVPYQTTVPDKTSFWLLAPQGFFYPSDLPDENVTADRRLLILIKPTITKPEEQTPPQSLGGMGGGMGGMGSGFGGGTNQ